MNDLKAVVQDGQELLKAGATAATKRARLGCETTDRAIRDHPYETLGIVFGVGLLAGLLMARSMPCERELIRD